MASDSHTTTPTPAPTSPPADDPALSDSPNAQDSYEVFFESGTAPSLQLDIPNPTQPSSPSVVSSEPPSPSALPIPLAADSGSGSTTTDTAASSASPHTSLSASLSSLSSSSSLPAAPSSALTVKFAPLPQLAPRKRRSTTPLGMAARGQLVRGQQQRRRAALGETVPPHSALPPDVVLTPAQLEELRLKQEAAAARYAHFQGSAHALAARETEAEVVEEEEAKEARAREKADREREKGVDRERGGDGHGARGAHGEEDEDPLLALGKAVKGVGRFWRRRVSSRVDLEATLHKDGERAGGGVVKRRKSDLGRHSDSFAAASSSSPPPVPPVPLRPILANITTNIAPDVAPLPQGDDAATIVPRRRSKSKTRAEGEQVDREEGERTQDEDERIQEQHHEERDQDEREQRQEHDDNDEQGGVWEEEIGDGIPLNAGQTQTIVGGRVVASVVSVASAATTAPGASMSSPTTTTTTTTIEVTATATAAKTHGKTDSAGKAEGARLVKASVRRSLIRRGKAQVGGAQA